MSRDLFPLMSF